ARSAAAPPRAAASPRAAAPRAAAASPAPPHRAAATNDNEPPTGGARDKNRRRPTLPGSCEPSTIGAEGLNCSVRNGKRCFPLAIATGKGRETCPPGGPSKPHSATGHQKKTVKPSDH